MNKEEIKCITKEQLNQLEWSDTHEYGTTLAYELIERIDKAIEWIDWFRKDNKEFYKNKIGLTMAELDGLENILKGE